MKKSVTLFVIIIAVLVLFFSFYFILTKPYDKGEFSVSDYSEEIENVNFQIEKTYGNITDYKSAAKVGKAAISERFNISDSSIFEWIGCDVKYDEENDAYYVHTYHISPVPMFGGEHYLIIRSDGTVLSIWGEK